MLKSRSIIALTVVVLFLVGIYSATVVLVKQPGTLEPEALASTQSFLSPSMETLNHEEQSIAMFRESMDAIRSPLKEMIYARQLLWYLIQQEQTAWAKIFQEKQLVVSDSELAEREETIRVTVLPVYFKNTASYEQALLNKIQEVEHTGVITPPSSPKLELLGQLGALLAQYMTHISIEDLARDELNDIHNMFLADQPLLNDMAVSGGDYNLGTLASIIAEREKRVLEYQDEVESVLQRLQDRREILEYDVVQEILQVVEEQRTLINILDARLKTISSAKDVNPKQQSIISLLKQIGEKRSRRMRQYVASKLDPFQLDQETLLYHPEMEEDSELSRLRMARAEVADQIWLSVSSRLPSLLALRDSVDIRNQVYRDALPSIVPVDGKEEGSIWLQTQRLLEHEQTLFDYIDELKVVVQAANQEPSSTRLFSRENSAAIVILGYVSELMPIIGDMLTNSMANLLQNWDVSGDIPELHARVKEKAQVLRKFTSVSSQITEVIDTLKQHDAHEKRLFNQLQVIMHELNTLHLERLKEAFNQAQITSKENGMPESTEYILTRMVKRWLVQQISDNEELLRLANEIAAQETWVWRGKENLLWDTVMRSGVGLHLIEEQLAMLPSLPGKLAQAIDPAIDVSDRSHALLWISGKLGFLYGVGERDGVYAAVLTDGKNRLRIEGIGGDQLRIVTPHAASAYQHSPVRWIIEGLPKAYADEEMGLAEKVFHITYASGERTWETIKKERMSYYIIAGVGGAGAVIALTGVGIVIAGSAVAGATIATIGGAIVTGTPAALALQLWAHSMVSTTKVAVEAIEPNNKEYQSWISTAENIYSIGKLLEPGAKAAGSASKTRKLTKQASKASELMHRQAVLIEKTRRAVEAHRRSPSTRTLARLIREEEKLEKVLENIRGLELLTGKSTASLVHESQKALKELRNELGKWYVEKAVQKGAKALKPKIIKTTNLIVVPPGDFEPGSVAAFKAHADIQEIDGITKKLVSTAPRQDVSSTATWSFSTGSGIGGGKVRAECSDAGKTISATATLSGLSASQSATVNKLKLTGIKITVRPDRAKPGDTVGLDAKGTYQNNDGSCRKDNKDVVDRSQWSVSAGGSASGSSLNISPDKESGEVTVTAMVEGIVSNQAAVSIIAPTLERLEVRAPASVDPCQHIVFDAYGYYSNKPTIPKPVTGLVSWSFTGRYSKAGPNNIRAEWPGDTITGKAGLEDKQAEGVVRVSKSEPNIIFTGAPFAVDIGDSFSNQAYYFHCEGTGGVAKDVSWVSTNQDLLSCSEQGQCIGVKAGEATIQLFYQGAMVASQSVRVRPIYRSKEEIIEAIKEKRKEPPTGSLLQQQLGKATEGTTGYIKIPGSGQCIEYDPTNPACEPGAGGSTSLQPTKETIARLLRLGEQIETQPGTQSEQSEGGVSGQPGQLIPPEYTGSSEETEEVEETETHLWPPRRPRRGGVEEFVEGPLIPGREPGVKAPTKPQVASSQPAEAVKPSAPAQQPAPGRSQAEKWVHVQTLTIPWHKDVYTQTLKEHTNYRFVFSGVMSPWPEQKDGMDAAYCYRKDTRQRGCQSVDTHQYLKLDTGAYYGSSPFTANRTIKYNPQHVYEGLYTGHGKPAKVKFCCFSDPLFSHWAEKTGSLTLKIYEQRFQ